MKIRMTAMDMRSNEEKLKGRRMVKAMWRMKHRRWSVVSNAMVSLISEASG